jgi:cardiolipin synthase
MEWNYWLGLLPFGVDVTIRVATAARVIYRRDKVTSSLSWLIFLTFVPVFSWVLYLLIGEPRLGRRSLESFEHLCSEQRAATLDLWLDRSRSQQLLDPNLGQVARICEAVSDYPAIGGNSLLLMDNASSVLDSLIADIDAATHHCHLLYYIWMPAGGGLRVSHALSRAASRGVICRVLVDAVGSRAFLSSPAADEMRAAGVQIVAALPVRAYRVFFERVDLRNHRKLAVIDGRTAYCGSQNITDETFRSRRRRKVGPWIDATVRLEGPAVAALQSVFLRDWAFDSHETVKNLSDYFPEPPVKEGSVIQVVPSGPGPQPDAIHQALLSLIYAAREEIIMTTPYFVPDEASLGALINAALRGVDVTLVLPDVLDAPIVAAASRSFYEDLLIAGVKIMHHTDGLLHAKTATIDRRLAVITSANLDIRSFWLNFELSLFIYDTDFASTLRFMQSKYIAESEAITLDKQRARPRWRRFTENAAQLLAPLL